MINQLAKETHDNAEAKGFNHNDIPRLLCLVHSEVSEALEADRTDHRADRISWSLGISDDITDFESFIKNSFEDELADIMLRVMGIAHSKGIDLEFHIREKMKYNATRPIKHGGKKY